MEKSNELFLNKFHTKSMRVQGWDYSSPAYYFCTICIKNREPYFGHIKNDLMYLSKIGDIVLYNLLETPDYFPYVVLDDFMIMPNHLHVIIRIFWNDNPLYWKTSYDGGFLCSDGKTGDDGGFLCRDAINRVSTQKTSLPKTQKTSRGQNSKSTGGITGMHNPMLQPHSLSNFVRSFKAKCTNQIRKTHLPLFQWQPRFYEHIIRNDFDLMRIQKYIIKNPAKWGLDRNNKIGLWM
ncbi:hypothetical protein KKA57_02495 [Patescibacteria group bacterium]|nr:hypothetical protein [Patescibacteria group bacterium]